MNLWPHQIKAIQQVTDEFRKGHKAVCVVASTGSGKSRLAGELARLHLAKKPDGKVLFIAHRDELIGQTYDLFTSLGLSSGVIQANPCRPTNPFRGCQIASVQTLLARDMVIDGVTLAIPDEIHHFASDKWSVLAEGYKRRGARLIGLTATPMRADGRGLDGLFDSLVCPISMKELIREGFLVPFELKRPARALQPNQIAQSPVDAYLEHAPGLKTIVFAAHIKAATSFRDEFRAKGIAAEIVTGAMDVGERRSILAAFKAGKITVLCNVGVLTEGFDDRSLACVILARSIGSLSLYLQMVGRALRLSLETGKTHAVLIDLFGSSHALGAPDDDREWSLEGDGLKHGKKLEQAPERFCPVCGVLLEGDAGICELCGICKPELAPPDVVNVPLVKYEAKKREPEEVRFAYFRKLQAIAREKEWSKWQPLMKYRAIYGEEVPRKWLTT